MKHIIVDTDPGHDDALALMLLCGNPAVSIEQITTVAGNAEIGKTTRNAAAVLHVIEKPEIPIYSGASQPLQKPLTLANVHGKSGLDGANLPEEHTVSLTNDAPDRIIQAIRSKPRGSVTLLTLGPLTNIALALHRDPTLLEACAETIIMGGAIHVPGNKSRVAEFNIFVDPHAAEIVLAAPGNKTLVPLDACNETVLQMSDLDQYPNTRTTDFLRDILKPYIKNIEHFLGVRGALLYDPLAAYYAIAPSEFETDMMDIRIETRGVYTEGMTVAERRTNIPSEKNVRVVTSVPSSRFLQALQQAIARLP